MKSILICIPILFLLNACTESFIARDIKNFNERIAGRRGNRFSSVRTDIESAEDVDLQNNRYQITLIHEGLEDDSRAAVKIVMTASRTDEQWTAYEIRRTRNAGATADIPVGGSIHANSMPGPFGGLRDCQIE